MNQNINQAPVYPKSIADEEQFDITLEEKYVVLKSKDIDKYLSNEWKQLLSDVREIIQNGRNKDSKETSNEYIMCNKDEAYAKEVWEIIKHGEAIKHTSINHV